jgi:hypothetical protein
MSCCHAIVPLLNHVGDINLGIHAFAEFPPAFHFKNSRTWSYTGPGALIEPKYFPSAHSTTKLMTDVPTQIQTNKHAVRNLCIRVHGAARRWTIL